MSALDKLTQVYDPKTGKWITKEQYKYNRDTRIPIEILDILPTWDPSRDNRRFNYVYQMSLTNPVRKMHGEESIKVELLNDPRCFEKPKFVGGVVGLAES